MKVCTLAAQVTLTLLSTSHCSLVVGSESDTPDSPTYHLDTVTVIGTSLSTIENTTQSAQTLTAQDIKLQSPKTLVETLSKQPNVWVEGGPSAMTRNVSIRGLGPDHTYVQIDGARQSYSHSKRGTLAVNPAFLKDLQIINGTSSGAAAGSIKASFIDAKLFLEDGNSFGAMVGSSYRTNGNGQSIMGALYSDYGDGDWLIATSDNSQDPYYIGGDYQPDGSNSYYKNKYEQKSFLFKGGYDLEQGERLALNIYHDDSKWNQVRKDYGYNKRHYTSASLTYTNLFPSTNWLDLKGAVYINNVKTLTNEYANLSENILTDVQDISDDSMGLSITNDSVFLTSWADVLLHYGASTHFTEHKGSVRTIKNNTWIDKSSTNEPSAKSHLHSLWLNSQFSLNNNLEISPKVRYDQFYVESSNAVYDDKQILREGRTEDQWSAGVRAQYEFPSNTTVFAAYDQALTPPRLSQLFTSGRGFKPNPNLKSERSQNTEIGILQSFYDIIDSDDHIILKANIFQNDIKDYIGTDYSDPTYKDGVKVNRDDVRLTGAEFVTQYTGDSWAASVSYSITIGKDQKTNLYLADMPADKLVLDLNRQLNNEWIAGTTVTHAFKLHRVPTSETTSGGTLEPIAVENQDAVPHWTTVDLYTQYKPTQLDNLSLTASVTNLFNKAYALKNDTRASSKAEYYEEGRSINLDLQYKF
ncbi:TonB-dependent receptor [Vibrio sp. 2CM40D]|uniref:TonB-dependent receptor domain-containing protein n=1 Tax=Vibrio sp. 2CM40D TaxID=2929855 RepID=UPI0020C1575D|nr:TonB-dependent receptor [Vibrio sp. 2CM40D]